VNLFLPNNQSRQLRFLDPDHRTCGNDPLQHLFALHQRYGAKKTEEGYYMRRTISTLQEIPEDKVQVTHVLRVLSYIARTTNRPIRIYKSMITGYNSEHRQAYSLVHAANLKAFGVDVVEKDYWTRAKGAQMIPEVTNYTVNLGKDPLNALRNMKDDLEKVDLVFDIDQLLAIDTDVLGNMTGTEGGYKDGNWTNNFACLLEHPKPNAIPPANDPLSKKWG
jgi:hypothetical protein